MSIKKNNQLTIIFDWSLIHDHSNILSVPNAIFFSSLIKTSEYYPFSHAVLMRMKWKVENLLHRSLSDDNKNMLRQSQTPKTVLYVYRSKPLWPVYREIVDGLGYLQSILEPFRGYAEELLLELNNKKLDEAIDAGDVNRMLELIPKTSGRSFQTAVNSNIVFGDERLLPILKKTHKTRGPLWEFPFLQNTIDKLLR